VEPVDLEQKKKQSVSFTHIDSPSIERLKQREEATAKHTYLIIRKATPPQNPHNQILTGEKEDRRAVSESDEPCTIWVIDEWCLEGGADEGGGEVGCYKYD
jgi:hypothetical protein